MITTKSISTNQLSRALQYARCGLRVLPVYGFTKHGHCACKAGKNCKRPGKHPRTRNGVHDATTDPSQIKNWWGKWPYANIGLAAGKESDIIVVDIDPRHNGTETLKMLEAKFGPLPRTMNSHTGGGGEHRFFKYPSFDVKSDTQGKVFGPGVDLISDGNFVVAPRSRHVSGQHYLWFKGCRPRTERFALPQKWDQHLKASTKPSRKRQEPRDDLIAEGQRNNHLTSLAGSLWRGGNVSNEMLLAALLSENDARCSPLLDREEVEKIVNSIVRYPLVQSLKQDSDLAEQVMQLVLDEHFSGGEHLMFYNDGQFWQYDTRKWVLFKRNLLENRILKTVKRLTHRQSTTSIIGQVVALLQAHLAVDDDCLRFLAEPLPVINCHNGELWIADDGTATLKPHSPKSFLRHCLDVDYDPNAECPLFDTTLQEIFANAPDVNAMVRHWNELQGYIICQKRFVPLIVIGYGTGNNGKTKLTETASNLLGTDLVYAARIESLDQNRFAIGSLLGKALLIDDDVSSNIKLPDGLLKKLSEPKTLTGERKFGAVFNFQNQVLPILLCNGIPSLADLSYGLQRRLMVIPFERSFTPEEDDRGRFKKIWAKELPGVLNSALAGFQRLVQRQYRFKRPESIVRATSEFLREANPLPAFLADRCERDPSAKCRLKDLYKDYCDWAKEAGITLTQQRRHFTGHIKNLKFKVTHGNDGDYVIGIRLKTAFEHE